MYVALSVCYSYASSNIIFMGFDFVDKVNNVVKYLVLFIFAHHSCAQLLTGCWLFLGVVFLQFLRILLCSIGLSRLHRLSTSLGMEIS